MIARLLLAGLLLALPGAVWADPISLIAAGAALGFSGTAALVVGALASYGGYALVAANYIYGGMDARRRARNQAGDARRAYNAGLQDRNASVLQADPPWRVVYGQCRTGGDIVAIFTSDKAGIRTDGTAYTKPDAYKHLVVVVAAHEVADITEMYIDGVAVGALDGSRWAATGDLVKTIAVSQEISIASGASATLPGAVTVLGAVSEAPGEFTGGPIGVTPVTYTVVGAVVTNTSSVPGRFSLTYETTAGSIRWDKHLGATTQTVDTYLTGLVPDQWPASARLRGLAYVVVTLDLEDQRWQGGPPQMAWDVRGRKVYDPRTGITAWSDNPALIVRDYLLAPWGFEVLAADIDDSYTNAAANACDAVITFDSVDAAGTPSSVAASTYNCNGTLVSSDSRERSLNDLCDSMGGYAVYGARWQIVAGSWTAPVMALTDDDLAGQIEVVQAGVALDEVFNGVRGGYVPLDGGVTSDFTYSNSTFVAADGRQLWTEVSLPFTNAASRCRNLARIMVESNRDSQVIRFPASLRAWPLQVGDRVTVTSAEYGFTAKACRVTDWAFGLQTPVMLTLQEDAAEVYDQADAAVIDPAPNTALPSPWVVEPIGVVTAASGTAQLQRMADGVVVVRVLLQWPAVADAYVADGSGYIDVQWRRVLQDEQNAWRSLRVPGNAVSAFIVGAGDGDVITVGITVVNGLGARSPTRYIAHSVIGKTEPPDDVSAFTVIEGPGMSRAYFWDYPDGTPDLEGFRARYVDAALAVPWDAMSPLFEAGRLSRSMASQQPADGEWTIGIRAYDSSGNESVGVRYQNVLLDQGALGYPIASIDAGALGWPGTRAGGGVVDYYLADSGVLTWDTIPTTWDAWLDWDGVSASPISYTHSTVDVGSVQTLKLRAGHVASGVVVTQYQSSTDNITYTAWEAVPAGTFSARYVRVRWSVAGPSPTLYRARFSLYV